MRKPGTETAALIPDYEDQHRQFARAFKLIEDAIRERVFPAASIAVTSHSKLVALNGFGRFTYDDASPRATADIVFDLASVTKVIATTAQAMLLYDRGQLKLELPIAEVLPEFLSLADPDPRRSAVTVRMLLAHSSGLPAYVRYFEKATSREEILRAAFATPLEADPFTRATYSDTGFILLGELLSRICGEPLSTFCGREVFKPLALRAMFCPREEIRSHVPPTRDENDFRGRIMQGEVNDENAWVMGGVAGHAGVFADALSVATFGHCMLQGGSGLFSSDAVRRFTTREAHPDGTSRALGWDTPSAPSQSGQYFSPQSFGHLGYTGTSLWCDPVRQISIVLLTNRTWPDASNQAIKQVRPRIHDAVMEAFAGDAR